MFLRRTIGELDDMTLSFDRRARGRDYYDENNGYTYLWQVRGYSGVDRSDGGTQKIEKGWISCSGGFWTGRSLSSGASSPIDGIGVGNIPWAMSQLSHTYLYIIPVRHGKRRSGSGSAGHLVQR